MFWFVGGEGVREYGMCDFKHECLHLSSVSLQPLSCWRLSGLLSGLTTSSCSHVFSRYDRQQMRAEARNGIKYQYHTKSLLRWTLTYRTGLVSFNCVTWVDAVLPWGFERHRAASWRRWRIYFAFDWQGQKNGSVYMHILNIHSKDAELIFLCQIMIWSCQIWQIQVICIPGCLVTWLRCCVCV